MPVMSYVLRIIAQANNCPENIEQLSQYKLLRTTWQSQGVKVLLMNSMASESLASIRAQAARYDIDLPIPVDETQLVAASLGIAKAGEVLVIDPTSRQLKYRG